MRKLLSAALLLAAISAHAADYYVVVPVPHRTGNPAIQVTLDSYSLPTGIVGAAYSGFNFAQVLRVSGDPQFDGTGVTWRVASGTLPAGLTLNGDGSLAGTPTEAATRTFSVRATYKSKTGEQAYQVVTAALTVELADASLPDASAYAAYAGYDFKPLLTANDGNFKAADVAFTAAGLPSWLTLDGAGTLSGKPDFQVDATQTVSFNVTANYRGATATKGYSVALNPETDPYWANVTYLFNFEGANGATSLNEPVKGAAATFVNSAKLTTASAQFGQTSLSTVGGYIKLPGSMLAFGGSDLTVEFFFKAASVGTNGIEMFECRPTATNGPYFNLGLTPVGAVSVYANGSDIVASGSGAIANTAWHHVAYSRAGGVGRIFIDGKLAATATDRTSYASSTGCYMGFNAFGVAMAGAYFDALRITAGVSRYSAPFTPPARTYPTR